MITNIFNGENYTIQVPDSLALLPGDNPNINMPHTPDSMFVHGDKYSHHGGDFINSGEYRVDYVITQDNQHSDIVNGFSFVRDGGGLGTTVTYNRG